MFSSRTPDDLAPNPLAAELAARRAAGDEVLDLTATDPSALALEWADELAAALAAGARARYQPEPRGLVVARRAVSADFARRGVELSPERVVITSSTSESYALLFKLLCDPGDEVLVPRPGYPLFDHLAALEGAVARGYPAGAQPEVGPRTRAIVAVTPSNPTGALLDARQLAALQEPGVPLICDEVFGDYVFDGAHASAVAAAHGLVFSLGGLSKSCGLPQLKLGWIAVGGPDDVCERALARLELIADTYLSVSTPVQLALPALLDIGARVRPRIAARVAANRAALAAHLPLAPAAAGWAAIARLAPGVDEEAFALSVLRERGVLVHPGYYFDLADDGAAVLGLLGPPGEVAEGARRLAAHMAG